MKKILFGFAMLATGMTVIISSCTEIRANFTCFCTVTIPDKCGDYTFHDDYTYYDSSILEAELECAAQKELEKSLYSDASSVSCAIF